MGEWQPTAEFWNSLLRNEASVHVGHPYPFYLASPLEGVAETLGDRDDWLVEWEVGRYPGPDRAARRAVFVMV